MATPAEMDAADLAAIQGQVWDMLPPNIDRPAVLRAVLSSQQSLKDAGSTRQKINIARDILETLMEVAKIAAIAMPK